MQNAFSLFILERVCTIDAHYYPHKVEYESSNGFLLLLFAKFGPNLKQCELTEFNPNARNSIQPQNFFTGI